MNTWITKADPKRVIPRDYLYLGRIQIASGQDSLGIKSLQTAYTMDTTQADVYAEIGKSLYAQKKYEKAGDAYKSYLSKSRKGTLNDYLREGFSYYFAYNPAKPDTTLLTKADSAFSYISQKAGKPIADVALYRARIADYKDGDRNNIKGLGKPYYEQYISLLGATTPTDARQKNALVEAYVYLGTYYQYKEKDEAKATENFTKAKELDPTNKSAAAFFAKKGGAKGK